MRPRKIVLLPILAVFIALAAVIGSKVYMTWWSLGGAGWEGLPLVELAVPEGDDDTLALILSGDGGWADLDRQFGQAFQKAGVATLGFDCLKYFWKARQPEEFARELAAALEHYLQHWSKRRLLLVGFSFGASWLPFVVNRLPDDLRQRVALVALLAPARYVNVEIEPGDWMRDTVRAGAVDALADTARLDLPTLCIYGSEEADKSLCPLLKSPDIRVIEVAGGHHFDHDYDPLIKRLLGDLNP